MIKAKINLSDKSVGRLFKLSLDKDRYDFNGISLFKSKDTWYLSAKANALGLLCTFLQFQFMKSGCPFKNKKGEPTILIKTKTSSDEDITRLLTLSQCFLPYGKNTMEFIKRKYPEAIAKEVQKGKKLNPDKKSDYNQLWEIMCVSFNRDIFKMVKSSRYYVKSYSSNELKIS